jgi:pyrroline-5-carboxylate reductase
MPPFRQADTFHGLLRRFAPRNDGDAHPPTACYCDLNPFCSTNPGFTVMPLPLKLLLIGAGKMGGAMLEGWLKQGMTPGQITVVDPYPSERMRELSAQGLRLSPAVGDIGPADVILLAVKPQMLDAAGPLLSAVATAESLLISVVAGKNMDNLRQRAPSARAIVRAMPNTPAAVGRGITGCAASPEVSEAQKKLATDLLSSIGQVEWVAGEDLIDAVTALSGSGPAYVFHLVEAMAEAGEKAGLPADLAMRLARATVEGAGELLYREPQTPASVLRQNVTSPAGTTAAALEVLMAQDGLKPLLTKAIAAARRRAGELSG